MNKIYNYILYFLCGIFIYYIINSIVNSIDKLDVGDDDEKRIYNRYVYTFHPDPIINVEQIANRDWSSGLNFYPAYCNLENGYGDDFYCNDFIGLIAGYITCNYNRIDIENSYIYLTRLKLPDSIFKQLPNNIYVPLGDCACTEFKDDNSTNIYGTADDNLNNGILQEFGFCSSNKDININDDIMINTAYFCCGKDWATNNIKLEDITTIFAPDGQFFTLPLVKEITYNCSCNIQTLEDANKLLTDTEKSLDNYLFKENPINTIVKNINIFPKNELIDLCNNINIENTKYDVNSDKFKENKDKNMSCGGTFNGSDCSEYYEETNKCPNECMHSSGNINCECSNCLLSASNCTSINNGIDCTHSYNNSNNNKCFWGNCYNIMDKLIDNNNNRDKLLKPASKDDPQMPTIKCAQFMGENQEILKKYGCDNVIISKYCNDLIYQERLSDYPINTMPKKCFENSVKIDDNYNCNL
jgi:hypothetical protein